MMASAFCVSQTHLLTYAQTTRFRIRSRINGRYPQSLRIINMKKRCLRCNTLYEDKDNSPTACSFHGHANGKVKIEIILLSYSLFEPICLCS
ncbi:hypothetical protein HanIR_Chr01g0028571 [Helianthus annuus]|nr:hypothetical protein HanIR_Chr01g0028571 [Helianthus annuus]